MKAAFACSIPSSISTLAKQQKRALQYLFNLLASKMTHILVQKHFIHTVKWNSERLISTSKVKRPKSIHFAINVGMDTNIIQLQNLYRFTKAQYSVPA